MRFRWLSKKEPFGCNTQLTREKEKREREIANESGLSGEPLYNFERLKLWESSYWCDHEPSKSMLISNPFWWGLGKTPVGVKQTILNITLTDDRRWYWSEKRHKRKHESWFWKFIMRCRADVENCSKGGNGFFFESKMFEKRLLNNYF